MRNEQLLVASKISGALTRSNDLVSYTMPFAVIASISGVLFQSNKFPNSSEHRNMLNTLVDSSFQEKFAVFNTKDSKIICHELGTTKDSEKLFFAYVEKLQQPRENYISKITEFRHDIQEPLRNIANFLQLIKLQLSGELGDSLCGDKADSYIDLAISNVKTLSELCNIAMPDSKLLSMSEVNLSEVMNEISSLLSEQIEEKHCRIEVDEEIPLLKGNYYELLRCFKNLVENSLRHSEREFLKIEITFAKIVGPHAIIIFRDNGKRLSAKDKTNIESLLSADEINVESHRGLGICKRMLQNNGGSLSFVKTHLRGCSYKIKLQLF